MTGRYVVSVNAASAAFTKLGPLAEMRDVVAALRELAKEQAKERNK